jgi:hypothetical protein
MKLDIAESVPGAQVPRSRLYLEIPITHDPLSGRLAFDLKPLREVGAVEEYDRTRGRLDR